MQDSVLDTASLIRSLDDVLDAVVANDVVGTVFEFDNNWELKNAMEMNSVDKRAIISRFQQPQESCRARMQRVPGNVSEEFPLATEVVEDQVASASEALEVEAANAKVTGPDALEGACE